MKRTVKTSSDLILKPIGFVRANEEKMEFSIEIDEEYRNGLKELDQYTHAIVVFWASENDTPEARGTLVSKELPFFYGEDAPEMGVFATRSEFRPNPVLLSPTKILHVDKAKGIVRVAYMDAFDGTPVIDLKPYVPMSDRVMSAGYPSYLKHWPGSNEEAMEWWARQVQAMNGSGTG